MTRPGREVIWKKNTSFKPWMLTVNKSNQLRAIAGDSGNLPKHACDHRTHAGEPLAGAGCA